MNGPSASSCRADSGKAAALYRYAVRDAFLMPLDAARGRRARLVLSRAPRRAGRARRRTADLDLATAARKFGAARFEALYRMWQQRGVRALWAMQSPTPPRPAPARRGRVEFAELPHQYLQLTPLVGSADGVEKGLHEGDNLATA